MSKWLEIEQNYVHDVYQQLASRATADHQPSSSPPLSQHVVHFVRELAADCQLLCLEIGCGNGCSLSAALPTSNLFTVGIDRCGEWFEQPRPHLSTVGDDRIVADVLALPFRSECFDAILFLQVLHHISTVERRVQALNQISQVLKGGSKVLITVKAFEKYKISSQDVLMNSEKHQRQLRRQRSAACCQPSIGNGLSSKACDGSNAEQHQKKGTMELSLFQRTLQRLNLADSIFYGSSSSQSKEEQLVSLSKPLHIEQLNDETLIEIRNIEERLTPVADEQATVITSSTPSTTSDYSEPSKQDQNSLISLIKVKLSTNTIRSNRAAEPSLHPLLEKAKFAHRFSMPSMPSFSDINEKFKKSLSLLERENRSRSTDHAPPKLCKQHNVTAPDTISGQNKLANLNSSLVDTCVANGPTLLNQSCTEQRVDEDVLIQIQQHPSPSYQPCPLPIRPNKIAVRPSTLDTTTSQSIRLKYRSSSSSADCKDPNVHPSPTDKPRRFSASPHLASGNPSSDESHSSSPSDIRTTSDTSASPVTIVPQPRASTNGTTSNRPSNVSSCLSDEDSLPDNAIITDDVVEDSSLASSADVFADSLSEDQDGSFQSSLSMAGEQDSDSCDDDGLESPMPDSELLQQHCYYHLFKQGEVEALITNHVSSLRIIGSYFSDEDAAWCVIAQKQTMVWP